MTVFTLNTNIPSANDDPSDDQPIMKANTQALNGWAAVDHVGFNATDGGIHQKVTFLSNIAPPGIPPGAVSALFSALVGGIAVPEWQNGSNTYQIPITTAQTFANPGSISFSNFILNWGSASSAPDLTTVTFNQAFSSAVWACIISHTATGAGESTAAIVSAASLTLSNFKLRVSGSSAASYAYLAIGV